MNTIAATTTITTRLPALALASLLTVAMLLGVNHLAQMDSPTPQMAQASQARASTPATRRPPAGPHPFLLSLIARDVRAPLVGALFFGCTLDVWAAEGVAAKRAKTGTA